MLGGSCPVQSAEIERLIVLDVRGGNPLLAVPSRLAWRVERKGRHSGLGGVGGVVHFLTYQT